MIVYTSKECTLQIPKGLGNFAADSVDIEPLSGSVIELSATTVTLSGAVETLEGKTSENTADIAALSGQVGNLSSSTVTGLETAQNAANSANILASSAYTRANEAYNLAESLTGGTGGPNVYVLNLMTQQERANLYAELAPYRWQEQYMAVSSGFPVQDYAFYYYAGEETSEGWQDGDRGFVPMQLTAIHPDDYGGALFFTGTAKSRQNNNEILWVRYNITSTGEVDKNVERFMGGSGGSGGNYLIVNSLSDISNPYEGLEAYVKERTEHLEYTGYTIDASQISEGYAAHIYYDGANETPVYRSGEAFYWEWDNGTTEVFIDKGDYYYKINSNHTVFTVLLKNPAAYVTFEQGVTTATTSGTIEIFHKSVTYRYNGTEWEEYQPPKVYYLDEMTQSERVDLYNEIFRYKEKTFPAGNYRFFVTNEGNDEYQGRFEVFVARFYQGDNVSFSGLMQSRYNKVLLQRSYKLTSTGDFNSNFSENTDLSKLDNIYDSFIVAQYDNGNNNLTGITHSTKATMWETYKAEGNEGYARKTIVAYVHTGDVVPARFNLISVEGNMGENENGVKLHFGAIYNSIADSSLHSVRFSLSKNVATDVYTIGDIVEYSYTAS